MNATSREAMRLMAVDEAQERVNELRPKAEMARQAIAVDPEAALRAARRALLTLECYQAGQDAIRAVFVVATAYEQLRGALAPILAVLEYEAADKQLTQLRTRRTQPDPVMASLE